MYSSKNAKLYITKFTSIQFFLPYENHLNVQVVIELVVTILIHMKKAGGY